jgi:hypothetical protein
VGPGQDGKWGQLRWASQVGVELSQLHQWMCYSRWGRTEKNVKEAHIQTHLMAVLDKRISYILSSPISRTKHKIKIISFTQPNKKMRSSHCRRSLTSITNHQHILHIYLIPSPNIGIGV